jgi:hypothetical protein
MSDFLQKEKDEIIKTAISLIDKLFIQTKSSGYDISGCEDEILDLFDAVSTYKLKVVEEFNAGIKDQHQGLASQRDNDYYINGFNASLMTHEKIIEILSKSVKKVP